MKQYMSWDSNAKTVTYMSLDKENLFYELARTYPTFETLKDTGDTRPLSEYNRIRSIMNNQLAFEYLKNNNGMFRGVQLISDAALVILRRLNTVFWRHGSDFLSIFKTLSEAVVLFESKNYLLSDTLLKFCEFRRLGDNVQHLNQESKNHLVASFELYLNKLLEDDGLCLSYFLNVCNRKKLHEQFGLNYYF
jgi:hypothetical protein